MTYWQVAAGEGTRDFSDVFLEYSVILMGSGHLGSFLERPELYKGHKGWQRKIVTLAEKMKHNDKVVMKRRWGTRGQIVAAGRVTGNYEFLGPFDDVDGWDMRHGRRVEWFKPDSPIDINGLARGTVSRIHKSQILNEADRLLRLLEEENNEAIVSEIPQTAKGVSEEDLVRSLIGNGLRPADAEAVIRAIWHVRRLAGWYVSRMDQINEHEIRTFLIVPILLALGWSEQRIKTEWNHTDISLFREVFDKGSIPFLILESKRMGAGLRHAEHQVQLYAKQFPDCNKLVTSTGDRYWLYEKNQGETWDARNMKEKHLQAYMNLFKLKNRHPYLENVGGAPELLKSLMPG